ncbi:response regulator [Pedobacter nutrimenti]|uniref:response regulator n=1 Tax=Pedobacter nutrimenti TaxID=1241337 RepID=UPI00292F94A9|nr:response regulator [Pedobacter nutrimenti]
MLSLFRYINAVLLKIGNRETDPINKARVKMLFCIVVLYSIFTGILIPAYALGGEIAHLVRVSIVFVCSSFFIASIYYTNRWKTVSHAALWLITLAVWSNLTIFVHGINAETLQFIWFACALSFYMHGLKWGWFYSAINILPVVIYTAIDHKSYFYLSSGPYEVSRSTYLFVTTYNFALIVFLHYYFFKAFTRNFINLTQTKNELKALNEKLCITLSDLEELSNSRMNFLSTMSHELRTPLNGVIGISNALMLQNPREDQEENLAVLKFSAENLLLLINDILDFNKLDSDKVELETIPFDLAELIRNNYSSTKLKAREKMLDFNLRIPEELETKVILSDPTRLTQILLNLLNNAIKFTEKGSVNLNVEVLDLTKDQIRIRFSIEDTGIGIHPSQQQHIFEPYTQASKSTNRNYGGTGLGLPIVKKVLTMFNSHINLMSTPNVGTTFFFDIDFRYQTLDTATPPQPEIPENGLSLLKVLVAEDNPVNILVIKKTLERWGIVPVIAENGISAVQKLKEEEFDVILMDLYMPEMDGYEATAAIRKMDGPKSATPIIALTASVSDNVVEKALEAGMNDYLSKPFSPEHLFKKLQKLTSEGILSDRP